MTAGRRRSWAKGLAAETAAALWLMLKGYRVLGRRVRGAPGSGVGEIDLIARRGRTLAFIEVKTRPDLDAAAFAIGPEQRRRIARAAEAFLAARPDLSGLDIRFDAVLVAPRRLPRHWPGAWTAD
ncbi:MAG: YraN family protein [Pseudomonadota bacterium]